MCAPFTSFLFCSLVFLNGIDFQVKGMQAVEESAVDVLKERTGAARYARHVPSNPNDPSTKIYTISFDQIDQMDYRSPSYQNASPRSSTLFKNSPATPSRIAIQTGASPWRQTMTPNRIGNGKSTSSFTCLVV